MTGAAPPVLVVFGGLPGVGKTTLARRVAARLRAAYVRIDAIGQAVRSAGVSAEAGGVGPAGYMAAYALAGANPRLGSPVVAGCVNPMPATREAWRAVAAPGPVVEVEVVCSNQAGHKRRVETRESDLPGLAPPSWDSVARHEYEPWTGPRLVLGAASLGADEAASRVRDEAARRRPAGRPA